MTYDEFVIAPVVKRISQRSSEPLFQVRVLAGAHWKSELIQVILLALNCGRSLVVGRRLAKAQVGVRFPAPAPRSECCFWWDRKPETDESRRGREVRQQTETCDRLPPPVPETMKMSLSFLQTEKGLLEKVF